MIHVIAIVRTCKTCPSQWSGLTQDGKWVYVRYRWGHLEIIVDDMDPIDGDSAVSLDYGSDMNGLLSYAELRELTKGRVEWPEEEQ